MITKQAPITHSATGVQASGSFGIKTEDLSTIFHILRNQLYKDPRMAVLREYSCNAVDANVEAGRRATPIHVTLPTGFSPVLKIRDFGNGLSSEGIFNVYVNYGRSTKGNTNDAIGMLGIGSKSGFSYVDSFVITSYHGGKKTVYAAFIDPSRVGAVNKLSEEDSSEPSGIEIAVPVKNQDIDSFYSRAMSLFINFKVKPKIDGWGAYKQSEFDKKHQEAQSRKDGYRTGVSSSVLIMGSIAYPFDTSSFSTNDLTPLHHELISNGVEIEFNIGDLEIAASREALQYTDATRRSIIKKLNEIIALIQKDFQKKVKECKSLFDAKLLWQSVNKYDSEYRNLRQIIGKAITWNGNEIPNDRFDFGAFTIPPQSTSALNGVKTTGVQTEPDLVLACFSRSGYSRVNGMAVKVIQAESNVVFVENDSGLINGIKNRVVPLIEGQRKAKVYLLTFANSAAKKRVLDVTGFDAPLVPISTLKAEPLSKYYGSSVVPNKKHSTNTFTFVSNPNNGSYLNRNVDFWEQADVNPKKDTGYYLEIDRFSFVLPNQQTYYRDARHINDIIAAMRAAGVTVPPVIYGFKKSAAEAAINNKNMVNIFVYFEEELKKLAAQKHGAFLKARERRHLINTSLSVHFLSNESSYLGLDARLDAFFDKYRSSYISGANPSDVPLIQEAFKTLNVSADKYFPEYDATALNRDLCALRSLFPLISHIFNEGFIASAASTKMFVEYIKLVKANAEMAETINKLRP